MDEVTEEPFPPNNLCRRELTPVDIPATVLFGCPSFLSPIWKSVAVGLASSVPFFLEDGLVAGGDIVERIDRRREFVVADWVESAIDLACCLLFFLLAVEEFSEGDWE